MSYLFDDGSSQYLEVDATPPVTAAPFTMSCFFMFDAVSQGTMMFIGDASTGTHYWVMDANLFAGGDPLEFVLRSGSGAETVTTSTGVSIDTWYHGCAVERSSTDHSIFLDGAGEGTSAVSRAPLNVDRISIGRYGDNSPTRYLSGFVAEAAIYDTDLSDTEVLMLAAGFAPPMIRPQNLVAYWPLIRTLQDTVGGFDLTAFNTPVVAAHVPIIYPIPTAGYYTTAAVGGISVPIISTLGIHSRIFGGQVVR